MRFAYTILYVPDVARSIAFYERAFGLSVRFVAESGEYGELDTGPTTLSFAQEDFAAGGHDGLRSRPLRPEDEPPPFEVAFTCDDVAAAYDRALAAGAASVAEPTQKPWGQTVAYVRDGDGAIVELCTPVA
ncbi:MAG TPA: VOC family protein [Solirubrobacteraceae bacterium]|jgi:catechol 2,3-dioxygenase-like lactoylglutathione lyase family enzyme